MSQTSAASPKVKGTAMSAMRSYLPWMPALRASDSSMKWTTCCSRVPSPTCTARMTSLPCSTTGPE